MERKQRWKVEAILSKSLTVKERTEREVEMNIQCIAGSKVKVKIQTGKNKGTNYFKVIRCFNICHITKYNYRIYIFKLFNTLIVINYLIFH